ncbi:MAG: hypothetical protein ACP5NQ_09660, partial [Vulcanisaeta sp.]
MSSSIAGQTEDCEKLSREVEGFVSGLDLKVSLREVLKVVGDVLAAALASTLPGLTALGVKALLSFASSI